MHIGVKGSSHVEKGSVKNFCGYMGFGGADPQCWRSLTEGPYVYEGMVRRTRTRSGEFVQLTCKSWLILYECDNG